MQANRSFPKGTGRLSGKSSAGWPPLHYRKDTTRERGRPARVLTLCLPLGFPAMRQSATLLAGTAWVLPKQSPGVVVAQYGSKRCARLCQELCGRDARAPGWASSHDVVTQRAQNCRRVLAPRVVEARQLIYVSIRVHSWFVFLTSISHFPSHDLPSRMGRGHYKRGTPLVVVSLVTFASDQTVRLDRLTPWPAAGSS